MTGLVDHVQQTAKRAGFISAAMVFFAVGLAFFTVSAWFFLATMVDVQTAAAIIGGIYVGLGCILVGYALSSTSRAEKAPNPQAATPPDSSGPPLVQAFIYGLQAGSNAAPVKTHHI